MKSKVFLLLILADIAYARDYAVMGNSFVIKEPSLIEEIKTEINNKWFELQNQMLNKLEDKINFFPKVKGVTKALETHEFYYDPSFKLTKDIVDHLGKVILREGETVNPFDYVSLSKPLIFLDASDDIQANFTVKILKEEKAKIILVGGNPFNLSEALGTKVYFDQGGFIIRKLGIKHVPAIVRKEGRSLKITEVFLNND